MDKINSIENSFVKLHSGGVGEANANSRDLKLLEQSKELESVFLTQMIQTMEKTIPGGGITGGGKSSLSGMMFSSVMADAVSSGDGIGLSDMIYQSLLGKGKSLFDSDIPDLDAMNTMDYLNIKSKI